MKEEDVRTENAQGENVAATHFSQEDKGRHSGTMVRLKDSSPAAGGGTVVCDGEGRIILPKGTELSESPSLQESIVERTLPSGVRHEVLKQLQAEEKGHSIASNIIFTVVMVVVLGAVWRYFPATEREIVVIGPVNPPPIIVVEPDEEYIRLCNEARELFSRQEYSKCTELLSGEIDNLMDKRAEDGGKNDQLLELFFNSVYLGHVSPAIRQLAMKHIDNFVDSRRDNLYWLIVQLTVKGKDFLNNDLVFTRICKGVYRKDWYRNAALIDWLCDKIEDALPSAILKTQKVKDDDENIRNYARLKIMKAQLLVSRWMLAGGQGKAHFDDDEGDDGVQNREDAWRICMEPEKTLSPLSKCDSELGEFLLIRKFIVDILLQQTSKFNRCYWNGDSHWGYGDLRAEQADLQKQLSKYGKEGR